jgi:segregation and condensation protein A
MEAISYHLPVFEGPLDLLLFLIQKNKLNIYDIPIAEILRQYMDAIDQMKELDLDIASEFLEMAARLVQIKSAMLLPKYEEEAETLRRELTGQLIEYKLCQEAARRMAGQYIGSELFIREPEEVAPDMTYRRIHQSDELVDAYLSAAGRGKRRLPPPVQAFHGIVARKIVSVSSKIVYVLRSLRQTKAVRYDDFFANAETKSDLVATFLALLELMKARRIRVDGEGTEQKVTMQETDGTEPTVIRSEYDEEVTES